MPSIEARAAWVESLGAERVWWHPRQAPDGSEWVSFRWRDETIEIGWQQEASRERVVAALERGDPWGVGRLGIGWALVHGIPLRNGDVLDRARNRLLGYSPELARVVTAATIAGSWLDAGERIELWSLAARNQWLVLDQRLHADITSILRVLFAANHVYEPPTWKWLAADVETLPLAPAGLAARLETIGGVTPAASAEDRIEEALTLASDVVSFASETSGLRLADTALEEALAARPA